MKVRRLSFFALIGMMLAACAGQPKSSLQEASGVDSTTLIDAAGQDSVVLSPLPHDWEPRTPAEMNAFMDTLWARLRRSDDLRLRANIQSSAVVADGIEFGLIVNTPEWRALFRSKVSASPLIRFTGPDGAEPCTLTGTDDTLGLRLVPARAAIPCTAETADFILYNDGPDEVETGDIYSLAYERGGRWYGLPGATTFNLIGYGIRPRSEMTFTAHLYPGLHPNKPGRYRFFKKVEVGGREIQLMAEFQLTDSNAVLSQKQLHALMDSIGRKWESVPAAVRANVAGYGVGAHTLDVHLVLNTPERQGDFRKHVLDSSALRFSGATGKEPCNVAGTDDTLGVSLVPEFSCFPRDAREATFMLYNESESRVTSGEHYKIAYEQGGRWYWLPINDYAVDIAYVTRPGGTHRFTGHLHPQVNDNRPGRYRFFTEVSVGGQEVMMMAEFLLE